MDAEQLILNADLRPTKARIAVLKIIAETNSALSHAEVLARLSTQKEFDRVTTYRVLDWLTSHQLIHKISGDNRAWKFQLTSYKFTNSKKSSSSIIANQHQHHAHLHCSVCGKVTCIHELEPHFPTATLKKYQVSQIEINIKGICADCA